MIYFDHAATTFMRPEVIKIMTETMSAEYGNPSSTHAVGRASKNLIERSRKQMGQLLRVQAKEILFTSGGTEGNNWIIHQAVTKFGIKRIITSVMEHHAVLYPIQYLEKTQNIQVEYVNVLSDGEIDLSHLEVLLQNEKATLVSLMHINNETGTMSDIQKIGELCKNYHALFHSDMVQAIGKYNLDFKNLNLDFFTASAHKFHGPKGVGFVYCCAKHQLGAMIHGGEQEKGQRAGTEPTHQIVGMAKALELSLFHLENEKMHILEIKNYAINQLKKFIPHLRINAPIHHSAYNILNIGFPLDKDKANMLLFHLDLKGIAISRGSACQSGSAKPSHVLSAFLKDEDLEQANMRLSFCHNNTKAEIDAFVSALIEICG